MSKKAFKDTGLLSSKAELNNLWGTMNLHSMEVHRNSTVSWLLSLLHNPYLQQVFKSKHLPDF